MNIWAGVQENRNIMRKAVIVDLHLSFYVNLDKDLILNEKTVLFYKNFGVGGNSRKHNLEYLH